MAIEFLCPTCQKHYALDERFAGSKAQCKQCGQIMRIPKLGAAPAAAGAHEEPVEVVPFDPPPPATSSVEATVAHVPRVAPPTADVRPVNARPIPVSTPTASAPSATPSPLSASPLPSSASEPLDSLASELETDRWATVPLPPAHTSLLPQWAWIAIGVTSAVGLLIVSIALVRNLTREPTSPWSSNQPVVQDQSAGDGAPATGTTPDNPAATGSPAGDAATNQAATSSSQPNSVPPSGQFSNDGAAAASDPFSNPIGQNRSGSGKGAAPSTQEFPAAAQAQPNTNEKAIAGGKHRLPIRRRSTSSSTGNAGQQPRDLKAGAWNVEADPHPGAANLSRMKWARVQLPVQRSNRVVVFPNRPSPYVGVFAGLGQKAIFGAVDLRDGKKIGPVKVEVHDPKTLVLSADGKHFAAKLWGHNENGVRLWSVHDGKAVQTLNPSKEADAIWFDFAGGNELVMLTREKNVNSLSLWLIKEGKQAYSIELPKEGFGSERFWVAALSPAGKQAAVISGQSLRIYEVASGKVLGESYLANVGKDKPHDVRGLAFSPDGMQLATILHAWDDHLLTVWDVASGNVVEQLALKKEPFGHRYEWPRLEWLSDNKGWLVDGRWLYHREAPQEPVYEFPEGEDRRRVLDWSTAVGIAADEKIDMGSLETIRLPAEAIAKRVASIRSGGNALDADLPPLAEAKLDAAKTIDASARPSTWTYEPQSIPAGKPTVVSIQLADGKSEVHDIRFSLPESATVAVTRDAEDSGEKAMELACFDLTSGKLTSAQPLHRQASLVDISPDGHLAIYKTGKMPARLDVVSLETKEPVAGWRPYADIGDDQPAERVDENAEDLAAAWFIDSERVLTNDRQGNLLLWKLPECRLEYWRPDQARLVALSQCRRYALTRTANGDDLWLVSTLTGETAGVLPYPKSDVATGPAAAFSADGKSLVVVAGHSQYARVTHFDLTTGRRAADFAVPAIHQTPGAARVAWKSPRYVMAGSNLLDLSRKAVVWNYAFHAGSRLIDVAGDRSWVCVEQIGGGRPTLVSTVIPSAKVSPLLAQVTPQQPIFGPGITVAASVNISVPGINSQAITARLRQNLQQFGVKVDDAAPIKLALEASEQNTGETIQYRQFGSGQTSSIAALAIESHVKVTFPDGKEHVVSKRRFGMQSFGIVHGQNPEQQLQDGMRRSFANYVQTAPVPPFLFAQPASFGLPTSVYTARGEDIIPPRAADQQTQP